MATTPDLVPSTSAPGATVSVDSKESIDTRHAARRDVT